MRNRDVFLPSITTVVVTAMMMFLSCAHQNKNEDDLALGLEDNTSEQTVTDSGTSAEQPAEETAATEQKPAEGSTDEALNSLTTDENATTAEKDPTLDALGVPADQTANQNVTLDGANTAAATGTEGDTAAKLESLAEGSGQAAAGSGALEAEMGLLAGAETQQPEQAVTSEPQVDTSIPPATTAEALPSEPLGSSLPDSSLDTSGPRASRSFSVSAPKIPKKAITRKGVLLNRFYFARQGDTSTTVSKLLYGDESKAATVAAWNGGRRWKPGKIIYYSSPMDAQDTQMRSFYQERNVPSEDYSVVRGDWLSRIASKKLGSPHSWKEVAVINGMDRPNDLEPGQKLALYPQDLSPYTFGNQPQAQEVAQNEKPVDQSTPTQSAAPVEQSGQPVGQEPVAGGPSAIEQPPIVEQIPPAAEEVKKAPIKPTGNKLDVAKLVEQNLFTIVIGAGLVVLLLALSAINKRKKSRGSDDFNEEGFAPPSKLKRK